MGENAALALECVNENERERMESGQSVETGRPNPGRLLNGNPPGDPSKSPRCGARCRRTGKPCRAPAMWSKAAGRYTRCRMHGGASTGLRTAEGLEKCRRASWKTGAYSADRIEFRREVRREYRFLHNLAEFLLEQARLDAKGDHLPMPLAEFESEIELELRQFIVAIRADRGEELAAPGQDLMRLAERIGYRVTRTADDTVEGRRMDRAELEAAAEGYLRRLPSDVAERLRALARGTDRTLATM